MERLYFREGIRYYPVPRGASKVPSITRKSKDKKVFRKTLNIQRRYKLPRFREGMSLIEVMLAISVLAIVVLGTGFFSFYTSGQINLGKQQRAALQLANQKLEELKADNKLGIEIAEDETSEELSSGDKKLLIALNIPVADNQEKKENRDREISLVSLYVEN